MRTAAYKVDAPSDLRRRGNEPRHILCAIAGWKGKTMELFLGGCYQGKKEYVLKLHPECKGQVIEGENLPADWDGMIKELQEFENPVIDHLHLWVRKCLEQQADVKQLSDQLLEAYPGLIFICDEIGNGIVPMDALERDYREQTGRLQIRIAEKAERVERIVCGISQRLK